MIFSTLEHILTHIFFSVISIVITIHLITLLVDEIVGLSIREKGMIATFSRITGLLCYFYPRICYFRSFNRNASIRNISTRSPIPMVNDACKYDGIGLCSSLCGSLLSVALLVITFRQDIRILCKNNHFLNKSFSFDEIQYMNKGNNVLQNTSFLSGRNYYRAQFIQQLDHWSYRVFFREQWANEAWGSYWNWDPKETWPFITWTIFAIYLHTRTNKNLQVANSVIVASMGFLIIWICYFGVNLLGIGLHSYGSFTFSSNL
ncbi:hypothetical protein AAG906_016763 [Vitis piasezkii]